MNITRLVLAVIAVIKLVLSCEPGVCFNWRISSKMLTLFCKIDKLHFKTYIEDPRGNIQAECLPLTTNIYCHGKYKNVSITLNPKTNELKFTLRGVINKQVNGNWTCRHGVRRDVAYVEVTVFTDKVDVQVKEEQRLSLFGLQCIDFTICISALSFILSNIITVVTMSLLPSSIPSIIDNFLLKHLWKNQDTQKKIRNVSRVKKCCFAVTVIIYFGTAVLSGWIDNVNCYWKWFFVGFGILVGCISSLLFLSKDEFMNPDHVTTNNLNSNSEDAQTTPLNIDDTDV